LLTLIANVQKSNLGIGYKGELLHPIKEDFTFFQIYTWGKLLLVGKNTAITQPKILGLKNRRIEVISKDNPLSNFFSCPEEVVIIGGGYLYATAIPLATKLVITEVEGNLKSDTFFPNYSDWSCVNTLPLSSTANIKLYSR
jgi:dihydrofolate reductase